MLSWRAFVNIFTFSISHSSKIILHQEATLFHSYLIHTYFQYFNEFVYLFFPIVRLRAAACLPLHFSATGLPCGGPEFLRFPTALWLRHNEPDWNEKRMFFLYFENSEIFFNKGKVNLRYFTLTNLLSNISNNTIFR